MDERKHSCHRAVARTHFFVVLVLVGMVDGWMSEIERMTKEGADKYDISIVYEEKVEFLHTRITLRPLTMGVNSFDKIHKEFGTKNLSAVGKKMYAKLESEFLRIKRRAESVSQWDTLNPRNKRAIEFIGNLISKAFGNPGPEDWRKNNANILAMKNAIARQRDNSIILHNNIDSNLHAIEKHNELLRKITNELYRAENEIENELNELHNYIELEMMLDALAEIVDSLEDIMQDGKFGRCNLKGFDKNFLITNLRKLESNRLGLNPIFASWEWESYYQMELCSVALNRDELWITMRVPIVKHADRMARVIPHPNLMWIRKELDDLGIDIFFFKEIEHDSYSVITHANYEMCSFLGNTRVCNVRKTKFIEQERMIVPIDLNLNNILIISNMGMNESIRIETKCSNMDKRIEIRDFSMVNIPGDCHLKLKEMEIDIKLKSEIEQERIDISHNAGIEYKLLARNRTLKNKLMVGKIGHRNDSAEFEKNINHTNKALNQIVINHENISDDLRLMKIGGVTSTASLLCIAAIAFLLLIWQKCKKNSGDMKFEVNLGKSETNDRMLDLRNFGQNLMTNDTGVNLDECKNDETDNENIPLEESAINKQFAKSCNSKN